MLKKNYEFRRVYRKGRYKPGRYLVIYSLENNFGYRRLGITTSRKIGKAVVRNRLRRLIKESYRRLENDVAQGFDIVFVGRGSKQPHKFNVIKREMIYLLKKMDLLDKDRCECQDC